MCLIYARFFDYSLDYFRLHKNVESRNQTGHHRTLSTVNYIQNI